MAEGAVERIQEKSVATKRQTNSRLITTMMDTFMRGSDEGDVSPEGDPVPRAARLVENLWRLAKFAENEGVHLAASKEFIDRIDGKATEHKEVHKNIRVEGIVQMPQAAKIDLAPIFAEFAQINSASVPALPLASGDGGSRLAQ